VCLFEPEIALVKHDGAQLPWFVHNKSFPYYFTSTKLCKVSNLRFFFSPSSRFLCWALVVQLDHGRRFVFTVTQFYILIAELNMKQA
jgi:hypothetical protein